MIGRPRHWLVHPGNRAFTWLWWSQSASLFGSQVTLIAIPLLAAISLGADAFQMGMLAAVETVPYLIFSIPAGVLVDRIDRRGLLVVSNLVRAALLLAVPVSALAGHLSLPLLYAVAFGVGSASVLFDVAYQSYVPDLLEPHELLRGNQRLELSESAARTLGPGLGGALVVAFGGAAAIVVDAVSYLIATLALVRARRPTPIRSVETDDAAGDPPGGEQTSLVATPAPGDSVDTLVSFAANLEARVAEVERRLAARTPDRPRADGGAWAGLTLVMRDRRLRDMAASTATFNLASSAIFAVFILFAATQVGMDAAAIGVLIGAGNVGFVLGALAVGAITARIGVGRTLVLAGILGAVATAILPFAVGPVAVAFLFVGRFIGAFAIPLFNVNARALRQSRAPREALGRVNAVFRLIDWGTLPIGSLLGGWLGLAYGLRATLVVGGLLGVASAAWLIWSPLRHVRHLDGDKEAHAAAAPTQRSLRVDRHVPRPSLVGAAGATGWPLTVTGRLPTVRWPWLAIGGVAVQLAILPPVSLPLGSAVPVLYVASSAAVLACVVRNIQIPGLALIALGGLSNLIAIIVNGGKMPVSPEAARAVGHGIVSGYTNTIELANPVLQPLTDVIIVPPPLPLANVYSIGDLLIVIGVTVAVMAALSRQTRAYTPGSEPANQSTLPVGTTASWPARREAPSVRDAAMVAADVDRQRQTRREAGTQSQGSPPRDRPAAGEATSSS